MRRSPLVLSSVFTLLLAGCIDDPTAVEEEGAPLLSEQEIEFLGLTALVHSLEAQEAAEDSADVTVDGTAARTLLLSGLAAAPVTFNESTSVNVPCDLGGDIEVDATLLGEFDDETQVGDITFTMTLIPNLCQVTNDQGFDATLFGDPAFATVIQISSDGSGAFEITGGITGGLGALTGGRVANCDFDLAFAGTQTEAGLDLTMQGTACGRDISTSVSGDGSAT